LVALSSLVGNGVALGDLRLLVILAAAAALLVFLIIPRRLAFLFPVLVLAYFAISQKPIDRVYRQTSVNDLFGGISVSRDWIDCRGGTVTATLQSDPALFTSPQTVVAYSGVDEVARVRVGPRQIKSLTVPLQASGGTCTARFRVTPTAVPNVVTHGVNSDPRP